jgi:hypothetical protein
VNDVERFAALIAPAIDRVFVAGMTSGRERGGHDVVRRYGGSPAVGALIEFRTSLAWPGRAVGPEGLAAVGRYRDPVEFGRFLDEHLEHGTLEPAFGGFRATELGHRFLRELFDVQADATGELWAGHADRVTRLCGVLDPLVKAAERTGGDAFAAMAPVYEPPGAAASLVLLNRLTALRYHRADAHAAAWGGAGLTAKEIASMPPGPRRDAIEAETNRLASPPYEALGAGERLGLLADLAALPG